MANTSEKFELNSNIYLGKSWSNSFEHDPKTLLFNLSRYKFVSKMLSGLSEVLEVGCGEATGSPLIYKEVKNLFCVNITENKIKDNFNRLKIL